MGIDKGAEGNAAMKRWKRKEQNRELKKTQENSTTEKNLWLNPILHLFFWFRCVKAILSWRNIWSHLNAISAHLDGNIDVLASVQPHNHAVLKIAASVLISFLFVIQVQLYFVEEEEPQTITALKWPHVANGIRSSIWYMWAVCAAVCLVHKKKRASGAKEEHVAMKTAKHQPTFSRLTCHVCYYQRLLSLDVSWCWINTPDRWQACETCWGTRYWEINIILALLTTENYLFFHLDSCFF